MYSDAKHIPLIVIVQAVLGVLDCYFLGEWHFLMADHSTI